MRVAVRYGEITTGPAVYAMYGGLPPRTWVAYVGVAGNLQSRIIQHFDKRETSVVTGTSATALNVDAVAYVDWWEHESFGEQVRRLAGEVVAFDVLEPALRSRAKTRADAADLAQDDRFREEMRALFAGPPSGRYTPPRLATLAERVEKLERRVQALEDG